MRYAFLLSMLTVALLGVAGLLRPVPAAADEPLVEVLTSEPLPLTDFLKVVGHILEAPIRWDPGNDRLEQAEMVTPQNLRSRPEDLFDAVRALLAARDFALCPVGSGEAAAWEVIDLREPGVRVSFPARAVEATEASLEQLERQGGQYVTTTLLLEHAVADEAFRRELLPLLSAPTVGFLAVAPGGRGLVVSDFAPHVAAVIRTARRLDALARAAARPEEHFELKHLEWERVDVVLPVLREVLAATADDVAPRSVTAVPRINAILVHGTARQIQTALDLIRKLDVPVDSIPDDAVETVALKALDARRTAAALTHLLQGAPERWRGRPGGTVPVVVAHEDTGTLLIGGHYQRVRELVDLVRLLEERARPASDAGADADAEEASD